MNKVNYIALTLCLAGCSVFSQTIITDRPDQTESSSTIEKGSLQIETGVLLGFTEDDFSSERQLLAPSTLFRYGITNGIELRVLSQFESLKDQNSSQKINGMSDLEIGTKIQLFKKENINTEMAFLSHLILSTGSKYLSNNAFGTINKLSISHELSDVLGLGYNVGYDYFGEGSGNLTYSVALGISVTETFGVYIEPYGNFVEFDTHEASFDAGIAYLLKDNCQLDFSFGTGINHTMNYLSLGCSINIAKAKSN
ncbi:transporter [Mariniflexile litorale]|uniref:Transporter n=1 Tax=Mariniflexile litorale TaxID=3045158 RepID=A0AAU7EKB2_9FLAO|nr:transporter [Mariniflexile sp. KMM 9835]MDQ8211166.1 transporter [Mariniflexile sp. KMM 9835]